ncbi:MAG: hypothetical protein K2J39_00275, partial [Ruminococcus sp.]|nr:hypothetical protein [Ruminococcus sp.]
ATMTYAFASCGNDDEAGDADKSSTSSESSVSESSEEETDTETTTEEESESESEEDTTEEDTTVTDSVNESTTKENDSEMKFIEPVEKTTYEFISDADDTAFFGKWECEKIVSEGEEITDLMGIPLYAIYQLEIKDDGTAIMGESLNEMSDAEVAMTYECGMISDTEMAIINEDGDSMVFTIDGDYMIGTEEGYNEQLYFVKVDEFTPFDFEAFMNEFQESLGDLEVDDETFDSSDESVSGDSDSTDDSGEYDAYNNDLVDDSSETGEESVSE